MSSSVGMMIIYSQSMEKWKMFQTTNQDVMVYELLHVQYPKI